MTLETIEDRRGQSVVLHGIGSVGRRWPARTSLLNHFDTGRHCKYDILNAGQGQNLHLNRPPSDFFPIGHNGESSLLLCLRRL